MPKSSASKKKKSAKARVISSRTVYRGPVVWVTTDHVSELLVPKENVTYLVSHAERYVKLRDEIVEYLRTVMPS